MVKVTLTAVLLVIFFISVEAFKPQKMFKDGGDKNFVKTLDKETKEKYFTIIKNKNSTKAGMESQLNALVQTLSPDQQDKYNQMKQSRQDKMDMLKAKVADMMPSFSAPTQKVVREIEEILENKNLTCAEARERLQQIRKNSPKETQNELRKIFRSLKGGKKGEIKQEGRFDAQKNKFGTPFNTDGEFEGVIVGAL